MCWPIPGTFLAVHSNRFCFQVTFKLVYRVHVLLCKIKAVSFQWRPSHKSACYELGWIDLKNRVINSWLIRTPAFGKSLLSFVGEGKYE